jgi:hypothetical protein
MIARVFAYDDFRHLDTFADLPMAGDLGDFRDRARLQ